MARVMITGGAGFIGSHLCERFLADGHEVICVDNFITGNADNIAPLLPVKRFAEALTMAYHRTHQIQTRIVRIFNTYGERMRAKDGRVVPNFITQALAGEDLTVYGDGAQTRSFCYISDLVEGIVRLLASDHSEPVNCGNPTEISILQFAERIKALTGSKSEIVFRPLPEDDPKVRQPDIGKARALLGWEPRVPLEDGLRRTIDFFRPVVRTA